MIMYSPSSGHISPEQVLYNLPIRFCKYPSLNIIEDEDDSNVSDFTEVETVIVVIEPL